MTPCVEIIAFSIQPQHLADFLAIKTELIAEAHQIPGLLTSTTARSLDSELDFVDTMVWESRQAAILGLETFKTLPQTGRFMAMLAGPPSFAGHFAYSAGDATLNLDSSRP